MSANFNDVLRTENVELIETALRNMGPDMYNFKYWTEYLLRMNRFDLLKYVRHDPKVISIKPQAFFDWAVRENDLEYLKVVVRFFRFSFNLGDNFNCEMAQIVFKTLMES